MGLVLFPGDGDNSSPDASWPHSAFAALRRLAETEWIVLSGMWDFGGERPGSEVSTAQVPLLDHPDAGGDDLLLPAEYASFLARLKAITDEWAREDSDHLLQQHIEDARQLTGILPLCIEKGVPLAFLRGPSNHGTLLRDSS